MAASSDYIDFCGEDKVGIRQIKGQKGRMDRNDEKGKRDKRRKGQIGRRDGK
jgi:hypothetical protein